jgi:flagellar assembly protein FliH
MFSSKVLRGLSDEEFQPFEFDSFDAQEKEPPPKNKNTAEEPFREQPQGPARPVTSAAGEPDPAAIESAFQEGRQAGRKEAERSLHSAATALAAALEEISQLRRTIIHNSSQDMLHLVLTIARQVLHAEITVKPETILSVIERALSASISSDSYRVKVHPRDLELVKENKPFFLARVSGLKNIHFEGDDTISRGGCRVESELGEVDATIETQLEELRQYLLASITG